MQILAESIEKELAELHTEGVRLNHIGRLEHLDAYPSAKNCQCHGTHPQQQTADAQYRLELRRA